METNIIKLQEAGEEEHAVKLQFKVSCQSLGGYHKAQNQWSACVSSSHLRHDNQSFSLFHHSLFFVYSKTKSIKNS